MKPDRSKKRETDAMAAEKGGVCKLLLVAPSPESKDSEQNTLELARTASFVL